MANETSSYTWARIKDGKPFFAEVLLDVEPDPVRSRIIECYTGKGFTGQGNIEEAGHETYHSWKTGAARGLEYAFAMIHTHWTVYMKGISGRAFTDTNPVIVGYAVWRAFFAKINHQPDELLISRIEEFVFRSWTAPFDEVVPDFFTLTFENYNEQRK